MSCVPQASPGNCSFSTDALLAEPKDNAAQCDSDISSSRRPLDKSIGVHMHLTVALLCLHLSFLMCCLVALLLDENLEGWVCPGLGLLLHWSLLATFCWMAAEGFHIYLLLIRVFNIYIRRYLLKVSLLGWGESSQRSNSQSCSVESLCKNNQQH